MKLGLVFFSFISKPVESEVLPDYVFKWMDYTSQSSPEHGTLDTEKKQRKKEIEIDNYFPDQWDCDNIQSPIPDLVVSNYDLDTSFYAKEGFLICQTIEEIEKETQKNIVGRR